MDYTSSYHQIYLKENKYDDFVSRGAGFQTLTYVFGFENIVMYVRGLRFYLARLKTMGITNKTFEEDYLKIFSTGILSVEYTPEQLIDFCSRLYDYMVQAKEIYKLMCEKNNLKIETYKVKLPDPRTMSFSDLMKQGQIDFLDKYKGFSPKDMDLVEIWMNILKSGVIVFLELKTLGIHNEAFYDFVNMGFSSKPIISKKLFEDLIIMMSQMNHPLYQILFEAKKERYGEITSTEISMSVRPNKAILVSGSNLGELEMLLEATKDRGVDIYTHGNMLSAHVYPKFKTYSHFVGHFSEELESYLVDFSNFPGSILLTRHSFLNVETFYQGRLYTTDTLASPNVNLIRDNYFEPLIQSALRAEGFSETIEKPPIKFNFSEKEFIDKITEVAEKMERGEIKHFFVLETPNHKMQKEYFEKLFKLLGDDCFVVSFFHFTQANNVLYIEPDYFFPFLYKALDILTRKMSIEQVNPIILLTKCGLHAFSNLVYMKQMGLKRIYLIECPSNLISPNFREAVREKYDIKFYTNPENDLKNILED